MDSPRFRNLAFYVGGACASLQAIDFFSQKYGWPSWLFHHALLLAISGLLILLFRWLFDRVRGNRAVGMLELLLMVCSVGLVWGLGIWYSPVSPDARQVQAPGNPKVQEALLRARYLLNLSDSPSGIDSAIQALQICLQLAPEEALAHAMLSQAYTHKLFYVDPSVTWGEKSFIEAQRAFSLDSTLAYAFFARGYANWTPLHKFPHELTMMDYMRSIALDPSFDESYNQLGLVLSHVGIHKPAISMYDKAFAMNPTNDIAASNKVRALFFNQQHQEVVESFRHMPPNLYNISYRLSQHAMSLLHIGQLDKAKEIVEKVLSQSPEDQPMQAVNAVRLALLRQNKEALKSIETVAAGRKVQRGHYHHVAYDIATAYALLGDKTHAMEWLIWASDNGFPCYSAYSQDQFLNNLRDMPEFKQLLTECQAQSDRLLNVFMFSDGMSK